MAVNHEKEGLQKASSLEGDALGTPLSRRTESRKRSKDKQEDRAPGGKGRSVWLGIFADVLILLVLAGVGIGIWFGYHAIRDIYAPVWEDREIELCVKITDIDYVRADELLPGLSEHPLWYGDTADSVELGNVTDVRAVPSTTAEGKEVMTLYLTVSVTAEYRNSDGYFVGDVRLLAGESSIYRANGLVSEGMILSLTDPEVPVDTQAPESEEVAE